MGVRVEHALHNKDIKARAAEVAQVIAARDGAKACADIIAKGHDMKW